MAIFQRRLVGFIIERTTSEGVKHCEPGIENTCCEGEGSNGSEGSVGELIAIECGDTTFYYLRDYRVSIAKAFTFDDQVAGGDAIVTYDSGVSPDVDGWHYWYGFGDNFNNYTTEDHNPSVFPCTLAHVEGATVSWAIRVRCVDGNIFAQISHMCDVGEPGGPWTDITADHTGLAAPTFLTGVGDPGYQFENGVGCEGCAVHVTVNAP